MKIGDRIVMRAKTKKVAPGARAGVIEQVLDESQPRLAIRWDDGRSTVIAPAPGAYRIEPTRRRAAPKKPAASAKPTRARKQS